MVGPSDNMVLVFRVNQDGTRTPRNVSPKEVFFCECTQKVHNDDKKLHEELLCHSQKTQS